jgi:hypothetical protein
MGLAIVIATTPTYNFIGFADTAEASSTISLVQWEYNLIRDWPPYGLQRMKHITPIKTPYATGIADLESANAGVGGDRVVVLRHDGKVLRLLFSYTSTTGPIFTPAEQKVIDSVQF